MKFRRPSKRLKIAFMVVVCSSLLNNEVAAQTKHPTLYVTNNDKPSIVAKIKNEQWAATAWKDLLASIDKYVTRHKTDPKWITSRLAMYWKDGEHYTQCYLKNEVWDYGTGNAPVPTVRMPGMRVWNAYSNVPLEDRLPYNETGDMKGTNKADPKAGVVTVPYKQSGHMIRGNNNEILTLAEKASFVYWITGEEKYAKFAADVFNTWLIGTYYMNPILISKGSRGTGGYEPGGIVGFYDYEQIHDDLQTHAAAIYDLLYDYIKAKPTAAIKATGKSYTEVASTVFKRFVDIGMVRGGNRGNWNINGWEMIMPSILVLDPSTSYADGKGKDYYIPFYTTTSTKYHDALPDILKDFNTVTGLWSESPGYALNTVPSLLNMATMLYKSGVNTIEGNPMMQKAALAVFPWLDARGNIVNFGDGRGGPANFTVFERLLSYYTSMTDKQNSAVVGSALQKGLAAKQYDRSKSDWKSISLNVLQISKSDKEIPYARTAYSPVHRHIVMKNGNDENIGMMFTLYGGTRGKHLSPNGLALQLYGKGWALAPDASGYESYWSADYAYHQTATGSNTILPGYTAGEIKINAMEPKLASNEFTTSKAISSYVSFTDVSADEKRRVVAMIRTSPTTGYYVDVFRSNQNDNDYLYHNLGNTLQLKDASGKNLELSATTLDTTNGAGYKYFRNPKKATISSDLSATWTITSTTPNIVMNMWMKGEDGRELYRLDAPYTNTNDAVAPNKVNIAPDSTPTIIVRQKNVNGWKKPFVAVFEPYSANQKSINKISTLQSAENFVCLLIESKPLNKELNGRKEYILNATDEMLYTPASDIQFNGTFGIASENATGFQYLYMGNGKLLQKGLYKIEADKATAAGIINENGKLSYSANDEVTITIPFKASVAAYNKLKIFYYSNGKYAEAKSKTDATAQTISAKVPAGYNVLIKAEVL